MCLVVDQTDGAEVEPLEKLYALLAQCIYRHRESYDKTQLLQVAPRARTACVLFLLLFLVALFTSPLFFKLFSDRKCEQRSSAFPEHQHLKMTQCGRCFCCFSHPTILKYLIISMYLGCMLLCITMQYLLLRTKINIRCDFDFQKHFN